MSKYLGKNCIKKRFDFGDSTVTCKTVIIQM